MKCKCKMFNAFTAITEILQQLKLLHFHGEHVFIGISA